MITYIFFDASDQTPSPGTVVRLERCRPVIEELYKTRLNAVRQVTTKYFCLLDGGDDRLLPAFDETMVRLCRDLDKSNKNIGSAREQVIGISQPEARAYMHHGVVCRTSEFNKLTLPESGNIAFEKLVYGMLAKNGKELINTEVYNWIPSPKGASKWKSYHWAYRNSIRILNGEEPLQFPV
jgi:hypothetical protein